jgi:two-component system OmpR family sensor kinase
LRTPLAGAIAQAQRLRSETADPAAVQRAADIEETLKRLTRRTERLMQLARAEGGRLLSDTAHDARAAVRIVVEDVKRNLQPHDVSLDLPETPVLSTIDPDALGIVCRNLVENALRHGAAHGEVRVLLTQDGELIVSNPGPVVERDRLAQLTDRFQSDTQKPGGSGLGLTIVAAIADRTGSSLTLASPRPGAADGFQARFQLPLAADEA